MALLLAHLTATAVLAGLVVVQLVVYPSFRLVGGGPSATAPTPCSC